MKQHPLCTDPDNGPTIMDLPIAEGMKKEWAELETRRHFLGKAGKVLGWAALASLFGDRVLTRRCTGCGKCGCSAFSAKPQAAQFFSQGQASDLPLHVRRPTADGPAGLQAEPRRSSTTKTFPTPSAGRSSSPA